MEVFEKKYESQIVRVKNGFSKFQNGKMPLRYTDIKYNLIFNNNNNKNSSNGNENKRDFSIICEVQFQINFMIKAKSIGHSLYGVTRRRDYIHSVSNFHKLQYNGNNKLDVSINKRNYSAFGLAMCIDTKYGIFDAQKWNEASTMHALMTRHWKRGYKLFHSFFVRYIQNEYNDKSTNNKENETENDLSKTKIQHELFGEIINKGERRKDSPLIWLGFQTRETFSKVNEINSLLKLIVNEYKDVILFDKASKHNWSILSVFCDRNHFDCLKLLLDVCIIQGKNTNNYKLNINRLDKWSNTPLIWCLKSRSFECLCVLLDKKYLLLNKDLDLTVKVKVDNNNEMVTIWKYCEMNKLVEYANVLKQFENDNKKGK